MIMRMFYEEIEMDTKLISLLRVFTASVGKKKEHLLNVKLEKLIRGFFSQMKFAKSYVSVGKL